MQLTPDELAFARKIGGARFAIKSLAAIDLATSVLFKPVFQSRALHFGDEVVVSCLSNPVVVDSLVRHGLVPIFVDVCFPTYQVMLDEVEEAINPDKCKAIFLPHIWGNPFDLCGMRDLANEYGLWLLSEGVVGAESDSSSVGSIEDISVFIDNGALVCSSQIVYEQIKASYLYRYWERIPPPSLPASTEDISLVEILDEYFSASKEFEAPGSYSNGYPAWTVYPVTIRKASKFSLVNYLEHLNPNWFKKPVTGWNDFRNKKLQDNKMYGIDAVMANTVLLNIKYAQEIVDTTKKFLEDKHGK